MGKWATGGVVVALLIAAALLLPGADSPGVSLADAAERIEGQSMRQRVDMSYGDSSGQYKMTGEGVTAADSSRLNFDVMISMKGQPGTRRLVIRSIGDDYWYRAPAFDDVMPKGKRWIHAVDDTTLSTMLTPQEFVEFLKQADEVEEAGEKRIFGEITTKYQGVIDLEELADEIGGDSSERLNRALEAENFPDNRRPGMGIDAYVSEDGLPVRLVMWGGESDDDSLYISTDILEYGVPVEVEPPPAEQVIEEDEFDRLTGG